MITFAAVTTAARSSAPQQVTSGGTRPRQALLRLGGTLGAGSPVVTAYVSRTEGGTYVPVPYSEMDSLTTREFSIARGDWYKMVLVGGDGTTSLVGTLLD